MPLSLSKQVSPVPTGAVYCTRRISGHMYYSTSNPSDFGIFYEYRSAMLRSRTPHADSPPLSLRPTPYTKSPLGAAMPLTNAGRLLFSRIPQDTTSLQEDGQQQRPSVNSARQAGSQPSVGAASVAKPPSRPREIRRPTSLIDMVAQSFRCCVGLNCVGKFVSEKYDARRLLTEQKDFAGLTSTSAKSQSRSRRLGRAP